MTFRELIEKPSAVAPFVLSGAALALVVGYAAVFGVDADPQGDEGTPARLFQLILATQALIMVLFALTWLSRATRPTLLILALQAGAAAIPVATILFFESR